MHWCDESDLCPECGEVFDRRPDLPGAEELSKRGVAYIISAMLVLFLLPPLTFVFVYFGIRANTRLRPELHDYRISHRIRRRRKLIELLGYAWFAELIAFFWLDKLWPPFMDWVGFGP